MKSNKNKIKTRRLSIWRLLLLVLLSVGLSYRLFIRFNEWQMTKSAKPIKPWFASYVDVTATPSYSFEQYGKNSYHSNVVLAFIVSSPTDPCTPTWGGVYTLDDANNKLDLDRRIARLRQQEGSVAVSFGGLLNDELALNCKDPDKLLDAYLSVIDRYEIDTIDLDLEGESLQDQSTQKHRANVIAKLQKLRRDNDKDLAVWLTLPVAPQGMTVDGTNAVSAMLEGGVDLAGVNVMTMDYGESKEKGLSMQEASEKALQESHRQLGILYKQAGRNLSSTTLWSKLGATPMIGQNDIPGEIFTLEDAIGLNKFATDRSLGRMSMWSANRDIECGDNYVNLTVVSDSCSGVKQERFEFAKLLSYEFEGNISSNASKITTENLAIEDIIDNPEESPYQIWSETATYLEGTKVVWHKNVYQAKWWTKGDIPDNPVLQSWETPWELIGPVLPGEKPIPQPTLPDGTYPTWSGTEIYDAGTRVIFNGNTFEAKWWTQGNSPAAASVDPDSSPWKALTYEEIEEVLKEL